MGCDPGGDGSVCPARLRPGGVASWSRLMAARPGRETRTPIPLLIRQPRSLWTSGLTDKRGVFPIKLPWRIQCTSGVEPPSIVGIPAGSSLPGVRTPIPLGFEMTPVTGSMIQ